MNDDLLAEFQDHVYRFFDGWMSLTAEQMDMISAGCAEYLDDLLHRKGIEIDD